jgi:lipopolysaccharide/colanic/teichoic acid biosynthesis glycosyltransferase
MGFVLAIGGVLGTLLTAVLGGLLTDECKAWLLWTAERLIQRAVRTLPESERERYNEEWRSHVDEVPGQIGKLIVALGFLKAGQGMSRILDERTWRMYDTIGAGISRLTALMIVILEAPAFLVISLLIKLTSPGPLFLKAPRVGLGGRIFHEFRFRTVSVGPHGLLQSTMFGRFLSRLRLDELPLLLNVLRGDMAFVGPRPVRPEIHEQLSKTIPHEYGRREAIRPGITGWAQTCCRYSNTIEDAKEKLRYDLFYIKNRSVGFDILILLKTIRAVFLGRTNSQFDEQANKHFIFPGQKR